jgi:predicted nucleic acid-binding protein
MEALGVLKGKWTHGRLTQDEYHVATQKLVLEAASKRIEIDDVGLFSLKGLKAVQALAQKHSLDLSDSLQLETILRGKYSHMGPNSASVLVTADSGLATAARVEGIRVWNCVSEPAPQWA